MNITQIYLTPDYDTTEDRAYMVSYQNETTYIKLFVEVCLRKNKIDIGAFNRFVFSEGGDISRDFSIIGNNAMPISLEKTYSLLSDTTSDKEAHDYYIRKFLEGFRKIDEHFDASFIDYLNPLLDEQYKDSLTFTKQLAIKKINGKTIKIIGQYSRSFYQLIIQNLDKNEIVNSTIAYERTPDNMLIQLDIRKVLIDQDNIVILDKCGDEFLRFETSKFI